VRLSLWFMMCTPFWPRSCFQEKCMLNFRCSTFKHCEFNFTSKLLLFSTQ
jgi:hypothetical protein